MKKPGIPEEEIADTKTEISHGSIYEQLGCENHNEMETKATLVMEVNDSIKNKRLTQTAAAEILGISQPKLSELLRGRFRGYSVERLMHFLNELGKDVDIVVRKKPKNRRARTTVYHSSSHRPSILIAAKGK